MFVSVKCWAPHWRHVSATYPSDYCMVLWAFHTYSSCRPFCRRISYDDKVQRHFKWHETRQQFAGHESPVSALLLLLLLNKKDPFRTTFYLCNRAITRAFGAREPMASETVVVILCVCVCVRIWRLSCICAALQARRNTGQWPDGSRHPDTYLSAT